MADVDPTDDIVNVVRGTIHDVNNGRCPGMRRIKNAETRRGMLWMSLAEARANPDFMPCSLCYPTERKMRGDAVSARLLMEEGRRPMNFPPTKFLTKEEAAFYWDR